MNKLLSFFVDYVQAVSLPTIGGGQDLPAFISSIYSFSLTIVGIAVFVQIVRAGFLWLTAAGNVGKASNAKSMITNAVVGAILLFAAYVILYTINPDLVRNSFNFNIPASTAPTSDRLGQDTTRPTSGAVVIVGTPTGQSTSTIFGTKNANAQLGVYLFTVRAVDSLGNSDERAYSMEVLPQSVYGNRSVNVVRSKDAESKLAFANAQEANPLTIATSFVPDAVAEVPYLAEVVAVGGQAPYSYSIVDGALPDGLYLQNTFAMPILSIDNLTADRQPESLFRQGDRFLVRLSNSAPNSTVYYRWQKDGRPWVYPGLNAGSDGWTVYGATNSSGNWETGGVFSSAEIGVWSEWARVGNSVSNVINFQVVSSQTTPTPLPNTPGGSDPIGDSLVNPECSQYWDEARSCVQQGAAIDSGQVSQSSLLVSSDGLQPSNVATGSLYVRPQYDARGNLIQQAPGSGILTCAYPDQSVAIRCSMPSSGEFCIIGRVIPGCVWP